MRRRIRRPAVPAPGVAAACGAADFVTKVCIRTVVDPCSEDKYLPQTRCRRDRVGVVAHSDLVDVIRK